MTVGREERSAPRAICFNRVVWDLEPLLRHLLGENIRIISDLAEDSGLVGVSLAQAQQIILNLALNARDAMPRGGSLQLETRFREFEGVGPATRIFEFGASDTGEGMDPQIASRMFDPFFTTKRRVAVPAWGWRLCARSWRMPAELSVSKPPRAKAQR